MYCFAVVTGIKCVINELYMWTDISSEHPVFLKTVAELTDKSLTEEMVLRLDNMSKKFEELNKRVRHFYRQNYDEVHYTSPAVRRRAIDLCKQFMQLDREVLRLYDELKNIGLDDKIWQTLVEHIIHEQKYMFRLFHMLLNQIQENGC